MQVVNGCLEQTLVWAALMASAGAALRQARSWAVSVVVQPSSLARDELWSWALEGLCTAAGENAEPP